MNKEEFNSLSLEERAIMLWGEGAFIESCYDKAGNPVGLYILNEAVVIVQYAINNSISNIYMYETNICKAKAMD